MAEEKKRLKFKVGDRVVANDGKKGTVARLGRDEFAVQVRWDSGMQELIEVSALEKDE